jgi:hypothetical protein
MSIPVTCTGCDARLKLDDDLAGKKTKCPRCKAVVIVPREDSDEEEEEPDEGRIQRERPRGGGSRRKSAGVRVEIEDDEDEEEEAPRKRKKSAKAGKSVKAGKYEPCPKCEAEGAKRVTWTSWGSFYGPAMLTHVRCPECGYCYNGRTGRSNALGIGLFVMVPLVGILAILGAVVYLIAMRGYLAQ